MKVYDSNDKVMAIYTTRTISVEAEMSSGHIKQYIHRLLQERDTDIAINHHRVISQWKLRFIACDIATDIMPLSYEYVTVFIGQIFSSDC